MRNFLKLVGYSSIAIVTLSFTITGVIVVFSAIENSYAMPRVLVGSSMYILGSWLMFGVYKGCLQKVMRLVGGVFFAYVSAMLIIAFLISIFSETHMGIFISVFCILVSICTGQLAACCFNPQYADACAERDEVRIGVRRK